MSHPWIIITAVESEADAVRQGLDALNTEVNADVVIGGIGRTNAAAATTQALLEQPDCQGVVSAGIAGALPGSGLNVGDIVLAQRCVYVEEGLLSPTGFRDMAEMGFELGDFAGNAVPVHEPWLKALDSVTQVPIATAATCSGTDERAEFIVRRTSAAAEAMEGAAVVHAARRLGIPGMEIRAISNTTGHRDRQQWDIPAALARLKADLPSMLERLNRI